MNKPQSLWEAIVGSMSRGNIRSMSVKITNYNASKPNGSSQAGRRRRAKRALSNSGRTRGRIR